MSAVGLSASTAARWTLCVWTLRGHSTASARKASSLLLMERHVKVIWRSWSFYHFWEQRRLLSRTQEFWPVSWKIPRTITEWFMTHMKCGGSLYHWNHLALKWFAIHHSWIEWLVAFQNTCITVWHLVDLELFGLSSATHSWKQQWTNERIKRCIHSICKMRWLTSRSVLLQCAVSLMQVIFCTFRYKWVRDQQYVWA